MASRNIRTVNLFDYNGLAVESRVRQLKSGREKDRTTISIKATPLVHAFDETSLGAGPAKALRDELERQIKAITQVVSASTLDRRARARKQWAEGASRAQKQRYSGGRTGATPPGTSVRMFNDSGRLADTLFIRQNRAEKTFTTNVAANRLSQGTEKLVEKLIPLVPMLRNPASIGRNKAFMAAVEESVDLLMTKAKTENEAKRKALRKAQLKLARDLLGLIVK